MQDDMLSFYADNYDDAIHYDEYVEPMDPKDYTDSILLEEIELLF